MKKILVTVEIDKDKEEESPSLLLADVEKEWGFEAKVKAAFRDDLDEKYCVAKWALKELEARDAAEQIERINRWVEKTDFLKVEG